MTRFPLVSIAPKHYLARAMADPPLRRTPLYEEHVALGARIVPFAGWEMPVQYTGIVDEHQAVRTAAGLFDVSHMGELELRGEYAAHVVDYLVTNDARSSPTARRSTPAPATSRARSSTTSSSTARAQDDWLIVCNASNRDEDGGALRAARRRTTASSRTGATRRRSSPSRGRRRSTCSRCAGGDARDARRASKSFHFRDAVVANVRCTVARTGYTGEDGVEIFCALERRARALARAPRARQARSGSSPSGLGARDTLRLEARLSLYGNDIDETTNPLEAGLGWVVKLDKGDFVGRAALAKVKAERPAAQARRLRDDRARHRAPRLPAPRRRRARGRRLHERQPRPDRRQEHRPRLRAERRCPRSGRSSSSTAAARTSRRSSSRRRSTSERKSDRMSDQDSRRIAGTRRTTSGARGRRRAPSRRHHRVRGRAARRHHARQPRREGRRRGRARARRSARSRASRR